MFTKEKTLIDYAEYALYIYKGSFYSTKHRCLTHFKRKIFLSLFVLNVSYGK